MSELESQIQRIGEKLQRMLKQRDLLLKDNEKMKVELGQLREERKANLARLDKLQQQVEILKVSKTGMKEEDKKQFEKRVNQYIREIDKCISLLKE